MRVVAAGAAALLAFLYLGSYQLSSWPDADWGAYAALLADLPTAHKVPLLTSTVAGRTDAASPLAALLEANTRYPLGVNPYSNAPRPTHLQDTYVVKLPIAPDGWYMTLFVPNQWRGVVDFPEGLRLLDYSVACNKADLLVDLFWLGDSKTSYADKHYYTAYVHVLNQAGERVSGYDVLLKPEDEYRLPETVLRSRHPIPLPEGLSEGTYYLAIGLYNLTDSELVPGNSIVLGDEITLGGTQKCD